MAFNAVSAIPLKLIDTLVSTSDTKGTGVGLPSFRAGARGIMWQVIVVGSPTALNVQLEMAMNDTDTEYAIVDVSTNLAGETRWLPPEVWAKFVRAHQTTRTGGTNITVQILIP